MSILDKNRIYDGWDSLAAGADAGRRPNLIDKNQCSKAKNFVFRGGVPKTRPGIVQLPLHFDGDIFYDRQGRYTGPATVTDAVLSGTSFTSKSAQFTAADVNSRIFGPNIPFGTQIASVESGTAATMTASPAGPVSNATVTIDRRLNPNSFVGNTLTGGIIIAVFGNFDQADLGLTITGGGLPAGTIITRVNSATTIKVNAATTVNTGLTFNIPERRPNIGSTDAFRSEIFQCASYYAPNGLDERLMVTIGGRLFEILPSIDSARVREVPLGERNRRDIKENWMVQADKFHITQDGEAIPIIYDGVTARRAGSDEVPSGTMMAYGIGRLAVVAHQRYLFFGDLFGSHAGDPGNSVLKFTETTFLSEGGAAAIPYTLGEITAIAFYPSQDTATGQGEFVVFTERGAVSFDLHLPREEWKKSTFQQIALLNSTARGQRAVIMINGTLWIRSDEGWRDYRQARQQAGGWFQIPRSTEVSPWVDADTPALLRFGSGINFDNRLIVTCNPLPNQGRLYHDGLLSLDFDVLSTFQGASQPAWDGHWTALKTLQLVSGTFKGKHRAFVLGLDEDNTTQLYEITTDARDDFSGRIPWEIEFRSSDFDSPFNEKRLYAADIWLDDVTELVSMTLSYRPDSSAEYLPWKTFKEILPPGRCGEITCGMCPTLGSGFAPRQRAGKPADDCEEQTGRLAWRGFEFQPKLEGTGHCAIRRMRLSALQEEEDPKSVC